MLKWSYFRWFLFIVGMNFLIYLLNIPGKNDLIGLITTLILFALARFALGRDPLLKPFLLGVWVYGLGNVLYWLDGILEGQGRLGFWIDTLDDPILALGLLFIGLAFIKTKLERNALIQAQAEEINERKALHKLLYEQAYFDELTGLGNRRSLFESFSSTVTSGFLLFIDLNHFKRVNDQKGHDVGDIVLRSCAQLLKDAPGLAYRIGGDEFVLILKDSSESECAAVIEQLHQAVLALQAEYGISFSIGQAKISANQRETLDELLVHADAKMYLEKQKYREQMRQH